MDGQAKVDSPRDRTNGHTATPGRLRQDLGTLAHDILALLELQYELLWEDLGDTIRQARGAAMWIGAAAVAALACLPVLFLGIAYLIAVTGLSLWLAMIVVAVVVLVACGVVVAVSVQRLRGAVAPLRRSQRELRMNLNWIKRALGSGRNHQSAR
jgi:hypothetical protein